MVLASLPACEKPMPTERKSDPGSTGREILLGRSVHVSMQHAGGRDGRSWHANRCMQASLFITNDLFLLSQVGSARRHAGPAARLQAPANLCAPLPHCRPCMQAPSQWITMRCCAVTLIGGRTDVAQQHTLLHKSLQLPY
jgi:hypothetical protein